MITSRLLAHGRNIHRLITKRPTNINLNQVRNSGHAVNYREGPLKHSKATEIGANLVGAAMWWWILWHLWHEYEHITGEFYYPDPASWSNKELGISDEE